MGDQNKDGNGNGDQDPGKKDDQDPNLSGNGDQDPGAGGNEPGGDGPKDGALTKDDVQKIIQDSISAAVKETITPEIDRRISGATKTIYKKAGISEDPEKKPDNAGAAEADKNRRELITVYAEGSVKEDLGKIDPEIQKIADKLLSAEIAGLELDPNLTNRDLGQQAGTNVVKTMQESIEAIQKAKVDALKKAGQLINIGSGQNDDKPVDQFEAGKKLAEKRHKKK